MELENIVADRYNNPREGSYINKLHTRGLTKIAQKVGEEAVETVIAALRETERDLINESSDLIFHLIVLLREKGLNLEKIAKNLEDRHK